MTYGVILAGGVGSRMGGDCIGSDLVNISTGYDFLKMVIQTSMGEPPSFEKICESKSDLIRFIFSKHDYEIFELIKKNYPDILYRYSDINISASQVIDSSSRFGFYILADKSKEKITRIAQL